MNVRKCHLVSLHRAHFMLTEAGRALCIGVTAPLAADARCPATSGTRDCHLIRHEGIPVHMDLDRGWWTPWSETTDAWRSRDGLTPPGEILADAPKALKGKQ